jgi:hypothetical protein
VFGTEYLNIMKMRFVLQMVKGYTLPLTLLYIITVLFVTYQYCIKCAKMQGMLSQRIPVDLGDIVIKAKVH